MLTIAEKIAIVRTQLWGNGKFNPDALTEERRLNWEKGILTLEAALRADREDTDLLNEVERAFIDTVRKSQDHWWGPDGSKHTPSLLRIIDSLAPRPLTLAEKIVNTIHTTINQFMDPVTLDRFVSPAAVTQEKLLRKGLAEKIARALEGVK